MDKGGQLCDKSEFIIIRMVNTGEDPFEKWVPLTAKPLATEN